MEKSFNYSNLNTQLPYRPYIYGHLTTKLAHAKVGGFIDVG